MAQISVSQRASALDVPPAFEAPRRRSVTGYEFQRDDIPAEDMLSLTRTASAISGHRAEYLAHTGPKGVSSDMSAPSLVSRPLPIKPGPFDTIHEVPSGYATPATERQPPIWSVASTRAPSPTPTSGLRTPPEQIDIEDHSVQGYPEIGTLNSWRGCCILLVTCGAQMIDNVSQTP